jgi:hypothetical protein
LTAKRPPRSPGGGARGPFGSPGGGDDTPAQTNLGLLLQRALQQAQQRTEPEETAAAEAEESREQRELQLCANCWNAQTFKDASGRLMARCAKDLWVKPVYTYEELNSNKVRRWYATCPEYDDSE